MSVSVECRQARHRAAGRRQAFVTPSGQRDDAASPESTVKSRSRASLAGSYREATSARTGGCAGRPQRRSTGARRDSEADDRGGRPRPYWRDWPWHRTQSSPPAGRVPPCDDRAQFRAGDGQAVVTFTTNKVLLSSHSRETYSGSDPLPGNRVVIFVLSSPEGAQRSRGSRPTARQHRATRAVPHANHGVTILALRGFVWVKKCCWECATPPWERLAARLAEMETWHDNETRFPQNSAAPLRLVAPPCLPA